MKTQVAYNINKQSRPDNMWIKIKFQNNNNNNNNNNNTDLVTEIKN